MMIQVNQLFSKILASDNFPAITKMSFGAGLRIIDRDLMSAWKKIGAFNRHVPILFKCDPKLPDFETQHCGEPP